jgi:RIO kinase 2
MRYLSRDDYRVLTAVEMTMRNHEMASVELITNVAKLRLGGCYKILSTLLRYKLVAHTNKEYDGYRIAYLGYDILALRALLAAGVIVSVGNQIGVGKESDIFEAQDANGNEVVIKVHRLGRTSFRAVRKNRDYMQGKSKASWLFMSRLAATKEFAFMKALYAHGFPTPIPLDQNRHIVVMSKVNGFPMCQIKAGKI